MFPGWLEKVQLSEIRQDSSSISIHCLLPLPLPLPAGPTCLP